MNAEQMKSKIRKFSNETGINSNTLLQMCLFEGVLEKLSKSKYSDKFILKGGLLIASLIGVDMRSTMDMDTTIVGINLSEENITRIIMEILDVKIERDIQYKLVKIMPIMEQAKYENFCASINCKFGKIDTILNIDITTGDTITPKEIKYLYPKIIEEGYIEILTYTIETILAEKFETISSRNILNTRARDFYDLYMLFNGYKDKINYQILKEAIVITSKNRNSYDVVLKYKAIQEILFSSEGMQKLWNNYIRTNTYANKIAFRDAITLYGEIGNILDSI